MENWPLKIANGNCSFQWPLLAQAAPHAPDPLLHRDVEKRDNRPGPLSICNLQWPVFHLQCDLSRQGCPCESSSASASPAAISTRLISSAHYVRCVPISISSALAASGCRAPAVS